MTNPMQRTDLSPIASSIVDDIRNLFNCLMDITGSTEEAYDIATDVMQLQIETRRNPAPIYDPVRRSPEEQSKVSQFIESSTPSRIEHLERHLDIDGSALMTQPRPNHARMTAIETRLGMMITEDLHPLGTRLRLAEQHAFGEERYR